MKRKGRAVRRGLKEARSKHASRWTRTGLEAYGAGRAGKGSQSPHPSKALVVNHREKTRDFPALRSRFRLAAVIAREVACCAECRRRASEEKAQGEGGDDLPPFR